MNAKSFRNLLVAGGAAMAATFTGAAPALAQECFIGEVRAFAGNFAPRNWALMNGQLIEVNSNPALFSILGTTFGGDGVSNFALPDMRSRVSVHAGGGPGLSPYKLGQRGGAEQAQGAGAHTHTATTTAVVNALSAGGDQTAPGGHFLADDGNDRIYAAGTPDVQMGAGMVTATTTVAQNDGQGASTIQPYLTLNHIICLEGIYPSRP